MYTSIKLSILSGFVVAGVILSSCASSLAHLETESLKGERSNDGKLGPSDHRAYLAFLRASDLSRIGNLKEAEHWLQRAIDYDPEAPTLYLKFGEVLAKQNRVDAAISATRKAEALSPRDYRAAIQLGDLYYANDQREEAEAAYRDAIRLDPDRTTAYLDLAYLYRALGRQEEGLEVLADFEARNGQLTVRPLLLRASLYKDLNRKAEAEADFLAALDDYPELLPAQRALIDLYHSNGDLASTAKRLEEVYAERPYFVWIEAALVDIYSRLGDVDSIQRHLATEEESDPEKALRSRLEAVDELASQAAFEKAMAVLEPLLEKDTDNEWALYYAGFLYRQRGDFDKAIEAYSRLPVTSDLYADALDERAVALHRMKRTDEAISLLEDYLEEEPDDDDRRYTLIRLFSQAKRYDDALRLAEEALAERPDASEATIQKAFVLQEMGRVEDAIALMNEAMERQPSHRRHHEALALIYFEEDRLPEAVDTLKTAIKLFPDAQSLRFTLATYYDRMGLSNEAIGQMQKILEKDEDNSEALNFIGYTWAEQGVRLNDAEFLIKRALELQPNNGYITDSLGWVYYKSGRFEEAVQLLERAVQLTSREPIIVEHLGDAYLEIDEDAKALQAYERAAREIQEEEDPDPKDLNRIVRKYEDLKERLAGSPAPAPSMESSQEVSDPQ